VIASIAGLRICDRGVIRAARRSSDCLAVCRFSVSGHVVTRVVGEGSGVDIALSGDDQGAHNCGCDTEGDEDVSHGFGVFGDGLCDR
jgi:hypothetical protein